MPSQDPRLVRALEQLKLDALSVTRLEEASFGSKVYRVSTAAGTKVLKLLHGNREYWRERGTLELLEHAGLVPRVIGGLPPKGDFDGALLLEHIDHENLASIPIDPLLASATGAALARIHEHSLGKLGFFGASGVEAMAFPGWWSFRRHLLTQYWAEIIRKRLGPEFVQRCCERLAELTKSFSDAESTCLIHCDFRFGNVLQRRDGRLVVIDFESSREGDPAYDFIKIWERIGQTAGAEWDAFLTGYHSVRPLPEQLGAKLKYYWFDLNFGFLYWAIDRGDERLYRDRLGIVQGLLEKGG